MACSLLGEQFDLHGGGADLQFPHHENEIAQSEGASGKPPAVIWAHNGLLNVDQVKMSKSLGNFFTIREVLARYDGETIRFFMLRTHYRSPFNFSDVSLDDARAGLRRLYTALDAVAAPDRPIDGHAPQAAAFRAAMNDDFNTPVAVAALFDVAAEVNRTRSGDAAALLKGLGSALGILQQSPRAYLQSGNTLDEARIAARIEARSIAKRTRDFALADRIRDELLAQGVVLQDSAGGTTWVKS
jgi:cysteinyl-tRNA synthetase